MRVKGKKATISVTLPPEKVMKARELGLNLSRILENALDEYLKRLEGSKIQKESNGGYIDTRGVSGFEPVVREQAV